MSEAAVALTSMNDAEFDRAAALAERLAGMRFTPDKRPLLVARLARLAADHDGFDAYLDHVARDPAAGQAFVEALATHLTRFLREPQHFALLRSVAPKLPVARAVLVGRVQHGGGGVHDRDDAARRARPVARRQGRPRAGERRQPAGARAGRRGGVRRAGGQRAAAPAGAVLRRAGRGRGGGGGGGGGEGRRRADAAQPRGRAAGEPRRPLAVRRADARRVLPERDDLLHRRPAAGHGRAVRGRARARRAAVRRARRDARRAAGRG